MHTNVGQANHLKEISSGMVRATHSTLAFHQVKKPFLLLPIKYGF
jgi:hypothetical protein